MGGTACCFSLQARIGRELEVLAASLLPLREREHFLCARVKFLVCIHLGRALALELLLHLRVTNSQKSLKH